MKKRAISYIRNILNRIPLWVISILLFILLVGVWGVRLLETHYNGYIYSQEQKTHYHSDDTAQANIIYAWQNYGQVGAVVGDDNWVIKYPLYLATNSFNVSPMKKLYINSAIVLLLTAILMVAALCILAKSTIRNTNHQKMSLILSVISLASIPVMAFNIIKMPNSRNIEIGIFMLIISLAVALFSKNNTLRKRNLVFFSCIFLSAIVIANDPMFLYLGLIPFYATALILFIFGKIRTSQIKKISGYSFLVLSISIFLKSIITYVLPLDFYHHTPKISTVEQAISTFKLFANEGSAILGVNILGKSISSPTSLLIITYIIITSTILIIGINLWRHNKSSIISSYLLLLWLWVPMLFLFSGLAGDMVIVSRYLIIIIFLMPIYLVMFFSIKPLNRQILFLTFVIALNFMLMIGQTSKAIIKSEKEPNLTNYDLIETIDSYDLSKGIGSFWDAGINSYLSNQNLSISPVLCQGGRLSILDILFEKSQLNIAATKTYYLYNYDSPYTKDCSPEILQGQLGTPKESIQIKGQPILLVIYDYDITTKMELRDF